MRLQQLRRAVGAHLGRNHALDIRIQIHVIDERQTIGGFHNPQASPKTLPLLPLPMKTHTDGHVVDRK